MAQLRHSSHYAHYLFCELDHNSDLDNSIGNELNEAPKISAPHLKRRLTLLKMGMPIIDGSKTAYRARYAVQTVSTTARYSAVSSR